MKFRSTLSAAAVLGSSSFLRPTTAWVTRSPTRSSTLTTRYSSTALQSTLETQQEAPAADEQEVSLKQATESRTVAEGAIVSRFAGGLTAVRLSDDVFTPTPVSVLSPDAKAKSVANGQTQQASTGDWQGKSVVFPDGSTGVVVSHRPPLVFCYSSSTPSTESVDGLVRVLSEPSTLAVNPSQPVMGYFAAADTDDKAVMRRAIFSPIPQIKDIALINKPMLTGTTMIDTLAPIGKGQNMLVISHSRDDLRAFGMDFMATQVRDSPLTKCVFATTESLAVIEKELKAKGIDQKVHLIGPLDREMDEASRAAEAVTIAGAGCAVGEAYALEKGMDALVIVDTIDLHKNLWDLTTRVLVDVFGIDAVVKGDREGGASSEMRAFYSSLIQRSAQFKEKRGGGSVTLVLMTTIPEPNTDPQTLFEESDFAKTPDKVKERIKLLVDREIPLSAATLSKIGIPLPTEGKRLQALQHVDDLISMSDGQIWFDERLEAAGQCPPMDPQKSITRIGIGADTESRADAPALRRVTERLRLDLSQASSMDGAENTIASRKQIQRKSALLLAMHQAFGSGGRKLSESCVALLAATGGYLDKAVDEGYLAGTAQGGEIMKDLLDHVLLSAATAMAEVDESLDLTDAARSELTDAIASFFEK